MINGAASPTTTRVKSGQGRRSGQSRLRVFRVLGSRGDGQGAPDAIRFFKDGTDGFKCQGQGLCDLSVLNTPDFHGQGAQLVQVLVPSPIKVCDAGAELLNSAFYKVDDAVRIRPCV